MATRNGRSVLASVIAAGMMLAPLGAAQAQGKAGTHIASADAQSPTIRNLSARGSIATVPGIAPQSRNLSARGSLAQVTPSPEHEHKANLNTDATVTGR